MPFYDRNGRYYHFNIVSKTYQKTGLNTNILERQGNRQVVTFIAFTIS